MVFANDLAAKTGRLRVHFIGHKPCEFKKTDAFLVEYDGEFTLIDGGMPGVPAAVNYLKSIRASLLSEHPELLDDENCKLRINWFISHFHVDHVGHPLEEVITCPFIKIARIVAPPDTTIDQKYNPEDTDGDEKYRPILADAIEKYCPDVERIDIPFGKENMREWKNGRLTSAFLPPPYDGGIGDRFFKVVIGGYYKGDDTNPMIPVATVNSGAAWHYFKLGRHSFLFTGDSMQRLTDEYKAANGGLQEAGDDMKEAYGDYLGHVSVVKFLHHGLVRDLATPLVLSFKPGWIVCSSEYATAPDYIKKNYPRCRAKLLNCGNVNIIFETDGKRMTVTETPVEY